MLLCFKKHTPQKRFQLKKLYIWAEKQKLECILQEYIFFIRVCFELTTYPSTYRKIFQLELLWSTEKH